MRCLRCQGLVVEERGYIAIAQDESMSVLRCLNCGAITDEVILKNRKEQLCCTLLSQSL